MESVSGISDQWVIRFGAILIVSLIALVYRILSKEIAKKLDAQLYSESISHIKDAIDGINGTAKTLKEAGDAIIKIQENFLTIKEFESKMEIHRLRCAKSLQKKTKN